MAAFGEMPQGEAIAFAIMMEELAARLLYAPADSTTLAFFRDVDLDDTDDPVCSNGTMCAGVGAMRRFCRSFDDIDDAVRAASGDFHRLFVGPGHKLCPPWSSVYADGKGLVNGPTAQRVKRVFREAGRAIPEGNREPWDHIAYELQFVADEQKAMLDAECVLNAGAPDIAARALDFYESLMAGWVPVFLDRLENTARTDFYRGLAVFVRGLMDMQVSVLRHVVRSRAA